MVNADELVGRGLCEALGELDLGAGQDIDGEMRRGEEIREIRAVATQRPKYQGRVERQRRERIRGHADLLAVYTRGHDGHAGRVFAERLPKLALIDFSLLGKRAQGCGFAHVFHSMALGRIGSTYAERRYLSIAPYQILH